MAGGNQDEIYLGCTKGCCPLITEFKQLNHRIEAA